MIFFLHVHCPLTPFPSNWDTAYWPDKLRVPKRNGDDVYKFTYAFLTTLLKVSWTEEPKKARRGEHVVRLFDEEGFAAVRKAQRSGADAESVAELASVIVSHPGAFNGPWVNSEILAAGLSILVAYVAFSTKSKLLS